MLPDECREQIFPPPRYTLLTYNYSRGEHPSRSCVVGLSYHIKTRILIVSSTTLAILQRLVDLPSVAGAAKQEPGIHVCYSRLETSLEHYPERNWMTLPPDS